MQEWIGIT